jgi:predicted methyltransferase
MQLVRDFETPLDYSIEVVSGLKISNSESTILDTCMGLGYTAISASKSKLVKKVITCEISEAVRLLAKWSPSSGELFEKNGKIEVLAGSAFDLIKEFSDSSFSYIIHDPPRFSHAPELYSSEFYSELFRVSKKGAKLFHYVGSVGIAKGRHIEKETENKLKACGFSKIKYSSRLQGLYFEKPFSSHPDQ